MYLHSACQIGAKLHPKPHPCRLLGVCGTLTAFHAARRSTSMQFCQSLMFVGLFLFFVTLDLCVSKDGD
jgi:hypothetical protein